MTHRPFVFLDIETSGGSPISSRITEIGAVRVEHNTVVATYNQLINPGHPLPSFITRITGITDEMLWNAPAFAAVADDLQRFLDGALFIAHNVSFDYGFIKMEYELLQHRFGMDRLCTARLSRALHPEHRRHNLDSLIERHGLQVQNRHRALDDARALHQFYNVMLETHGLRAYAAMNKLITVARLA